MSLIYSRDLLLRLDHKGLFDISIGNDRKLVSVYGVSCGVYIEKIEYRVENDLAIKEVVSILTLQELHDDYKHLLTAIKKSSTFITVNTLDSIYRLNYLDITKEICYIKLDKANKNLKIFIRTLSYSYIEYIITGSEYDSWENFCISGLKTDVIKEPHSDCYLFTIKD
jgi:hypothetical protein